MPHNLNQYLLFSKILMKQQVIELLDIAGAPIACYETDTMESLITLYRGRLFNVTSKGLRDYDAALTEGEQIYEKFRFVLAADSQQVDTIRSLEPVKCYLRGQDMKAKIIELNPYQSVGFLREKVEIQKGRKVKLVINSKQLTEDRESLVKYIFEEAIIHVTQAIPAQDSELVLYVKEPGADSKLFQIKNVAAQAKVSDLISEVESKLQIPAQFIYLVYGGKILSKAGLISEYLIQNKTCIYAVDSRKYMKRVPLSQYHRRVGQVRKVKQCNKLIAERAAQKSWQKSGADKKQEQGGRNKKTKYTYERSGTIMEDLGDDNQYFKQEQMNLESEQLEQFHRRGNKIEQNSRLRAGEERTYIQRVEASNEPKLSEQRVVQVDQVGDIHTHQTQVVQKQSKTVIIDKYVHEDPEGRVLEVKTGVVEVQADSQGNTHKHQSQLAESQGKLLLIETNEVINNEGALLSKEKDEIKISELQDGSKVKEQTIIVEEDNKTTITKKGVVQDSQGNFIKSQTKVIQIQDSEYALRIHEQSQISHQGDEEGTEIVDKDIEILRDEQGNSVTETRQCRSGKTGQPTILSTVRVEYGEGEVSEKTTKNFISEEGKSIRTEFEHCHISKMGQGLTRRQEESVVEEEGRKLKIYKQIYEDDQGNTLVEEVVISENPDNNGEIVPMVYKKNIEEVEKDQSGNFHYHKKQIQEDGKQIVITERDSVLNTDAEKIRSEISEITITDGVDNEIIRKQTNIYVDEVVKKITEETIVSDAAGKITHSEAKQKMTQLKQEHEGFTKTREIEVIKTLEDTKVTTIEKLVNCEGQLVNQNTRVLRIRETQQALSEQAQKIALAQATGEIVSVTHEIYDNVEGNLHTKDKKIIEEKGKTLTIETEMFRSPEGQVIKSITQIIEQKQEDGKVEKNQIEVIQEGCKIQVIQCSSAYDKQIQLLGSDQQASLSKEYFDDLLGAIERQSETLEGIQVKLTNSISNSTELRNAANAANVAQKHQDQELRNSKEGEGQQKEDNRGEEDDMMLPQEFNIVAIDKARNEIKLRIRYDQTVDEVGKKLSQLIAKPGAKIHFYKDGVQFQEQEMVSDLDIAPGDTIYFVQE